MTDVPDAADESDANCAAETHERLNRDPEQFETHELLRLAHDCAQRNDDITSLALYAATRRDPLVAQLRGFARAHATSPALARHAILRLGEELGKAPNPVLSSELSQISEDSSDNLIDGAVAEALQVQALAQQFDDLRTPSDQLAFVVQHVTLAWNPMTSPDRPRWHEGVVPLRAWAQRNLLALSGRHRELAARAICGLKVTDDPRYEFQNWSVRRYAAYLLDDAARDRVLKTCGRPEVRPTP